MGVVGVPNACVDLRSDETRGGVDLGETEKVRVKVIRYWRVFIKLSSSWLFRTVKCQKVAVVVLRHCKVLLDPGGHLGSSSEPRV